MKILIMGMGNVGRALAQKLRDAGHQVIGTTIDEAEIPMLQKYADDIHVLFGSETEKVKAAAEGCDAIVLTVAPNVKNTRTVEERHHHYNEVLVKSALSAADACDRVLYCCSFSVYGDGSGHDPITEETPVSNQDEPSALYFYKGEQAALSKGQGCSLRFPDMYGAPDDYSYPERVKLSHEFFGGKAMFLPNAPLYAIHYLDVVEALFHAVQTNLVGVFNVCDNEHMPKTNKEVFDEVADNMNLGRLDFTGEIAAPVNRISADKFFDTGFELNTPDPIASILKESKTVG
ncbi:MAG: nucleoside-diphosphate-sugar epimerase [Oceanicoccus sp.]|jgi:nucleoside-diphosphate-sugar epimerase